MQYDKTQSDERLSVCNVLKLSGIQKVVIISNSIEKDESTHQESTLGVVFPQSSSGVMQLQILMGSLIYFFSIHFSELKGTKQLRGHKSWISAV